MPPTWNDGMLFFNQMEHQWSQYSITPLFHKSKCERSELVRPFLFDDPEPNLLFIDHLVDPIKDIKADGKHTVVFALMSSIQSVLRMSLPEQLP